MSNVLNEQNKQQVIALGRLGWSLRRIQKTTGVRRETAATYLREAGVGLRPPGLWGRGSANPANEAVTAIGADGGHPPAKPAIGVTTDFGSELATPVASREAHPDADVITGAAPADVVHRVWQRHDVQPHRVERLLPAWGQFHVINQCGTKGHGRGGRSRRSNGRGKLKTEQESRAGGSIGRDRAKRPLSRAGILFVVLLVVGTAPPAKTRPAATVPPAGVVTLGVSNAQSGPVADLGTSLLAGSMAYFRMVDANGGVDGRTVELIVKDDRYEPAAAVANTNELILRQKPLFLFGYVGTPTLTRVLPLLKFYKDPSVVNLAPFTGADPQRRPPYDRYVFNIRASYRRETAALVDHLYRSGIRTFGLLEQSDAYGKSGEIGVTEALAARGLQPLAAVMYRRGQPLESSMREQVAILRGKGVEAVIAIGIHAPCAAFIRDARMAGWKVPIANISFADPEHMLKELAIDSRRLGKDLTVNLISSQVVPSPDQVNLPLVAEYRSRIDPGKVGFVSLEGWINAAVASEAIRRAGPDPFRAGFIKALESLKNWDPGIGVPLAFSPVNHQGWDTVWLTRTEQRRWVLVPARN